MELGLTRSDTIGCHSEPVVTKTETSLLRMGYELRASACSSTLTVSIVHFTRNMVQPYERNSCRPAALLTATRCVLFERELAGER
jgi:hypothetical protein